MPSSIKAAALALLALALSALAPPALAEGERAGDFDYYVLSLSWSPSFCTLEGDAQRSPQCAPERDLGFTLHGLWPQRERGWPSWCATAERDPSRAETAAMADIMGTPGLAWYQWQKHGRCSGLSAAAWLAAARRAYRAVALPAVFGQLSRPVRLPAAVVEAAFLEANPALEPDMVTVTCAGGMIREVRICLTRELEPRTCGADVRRDCTLDDALMQPVR
jgi:ribonuclease T2